MNKKNVLLRAPVLTMSGYGVHSRQIYKWLKTHEDKFNIHVHTLPWGDTPWFIDKVKLGGLVGDIMTRTGPVNGRVDLSIQVQLPNEWDPFLAMRNVGVTAGVETDICNPAWIQCINKMDLVIVPSEHVKKTFENSGMLLTKVVVVPEAFIEEVDQEVESPFEFDTDFNFLIFGQITGKNDVSDRKNTYNAIKWFCESFKGNKDVGLVIKTNSARNSSLDRGRTRDLIKQTLDIVRPGGPLPKVHLIHGELTNKEVVSLYKHPKIKALLALTRGEGYGLPILEAAACDLPVIATDWSGHLDFLNNGEFLRVKYDLNEVHSSKIDNNIFMKDAKWAEPRESNAKKVMKKFVDMSEKPQEWAKDLGKIVREKYSQSSINEIYDKILL